MLASGGLLKLTGTPPNLLYTQTAAASHSPKWDWITWGNIVMVLIPPGVLERHTISITSHLLTCIWITTIKTKAFDRFLEGFFVIEGQAHLNPHQNYRWCDSLVRVNVISKTKEVVENDDFIIIITFNIWLITTTKSSASWRKGACSAGTDINANTTRTSWMANNAMPDSITMNMICRNLLPSVEPKVRSTEVGITPVALRMILNAIMPVIRAFTPIDATKPVINTAFGQ